MNAFFKIPSFPYFTDIYELFRCESSSHDSTNIRNLLIYFVNCYFLMFGGSQVQKSYHASMNDFLTF